MTDTLHLEAEQRTLTNGARALLLPRPRTPTFALQVLVRAGSRHDGAYPGLAHLVEHLVFRASSRPRRDLYGEVEHLGGEVGGGTTRDYTSFELVVGAPDADQALALLPELVRGPDTAAASVAGEQLVVCQELLERASPARMVWEALLAALWGDHPLMHEPGGAAESVLAATPESAEAFHARWHHPRRLLVVGAGACAPPHYWTAVERALGGLPSPTDQPRDEPDDWPPRHSPGSTAHVAAELGHVHLAVGVAVPGLESDACASLRLLDVALGRGPGSRLTRAFAERGLEVPVQSQYVPYWGGGAFAALAASPPAAAEPIAALLAAELARLGTSPPDEAELEAARTRYLGTVYCHCETNYRLAHAAALDALFGPPGPPLARLAGDAAAATREAVATIAARHFAAVEPTRVSVGPAASP